jgi:hypothetical protein
MPGGARCRRAGCDHAQGLLPGDGGRLSADRRVCGTAGRIRHTTFTRVNQFFGKDTAEPVGHLITDDVTLSPIE